MNRLSFEYEEDNHGEMEVVPCIDGKRLTELITEFEAAKGYDDPAGGYAGLLPAFFSGLVDRNFLPAEPDEDDAPDASRDRHYLLGCGCGHADCWPLLATITETNGSIHWSDFRQPHRPKRDYSDFGPLVFDRDAYVEAITELRLKLPR